MAVIESRLEELGLAYIAGHAPADGSNVLVRGLVGGDLTLEEGYEAARLTGLSIQASAPGQGPSPSGVPIIVDAIAAVS